MDIKQIQVAGETYDINDAAARQEIIELSADLDALVDSTDAQLAEIEQKQGLLTGLLTTAKTSIVAAINELFNNKANKAQETPIAPVFVNGWSDHSAGLNSVVFYKDQFTRLIFRGVLKGVTINTVAFILPIGYRPTKLTYVPVVSNGAFGYLSINPNGEVRPVVGSITWFSLDGININL